MTTAILLLHRTQTDPGTMQALSINMPAAGTEPHALYDGWLDQEIILHLPGEKAKALRNLAGGVETNNRERDGAEGTDVYQIEIIGYSEDTPTESDLWYANVRNYLHRKCMELQVPFSFPYRFASSSADSLNVRLTNEQWYDPNLRGILGHCHVPENTHWDPGALDLSRLNHVEPAAVTDVNFSQPLPNTGWTLGDVLNWIKQDTSSLKADLATLRAQVAALQVGSPATIDVAVIARAVAAELALRLQA